MWRAYRGWLDVVAILAVGFVFLFPSPGVNVLFALPRAGARALDRIAELQARLLAGPDDADTALELADLYTWQWRPDWALATLAPLAERRPDDFRLRFAIAVAYADRFDFAAATRTIDRALEVCRPS